MELGAARDPILVTLPPEVLDSLKYGQGRALPCGHPLWQQQLLTLLLLIKGPEVFQGPEVLLAMGLMGIEDWARALGRCSSRQPGFLLHIHEILLTFVVKARARVTVLKTHVYIL